jgi:hypothetical protein
VPVDVAWRYLPDCPVVGATADEIAFHCVVETVNSAFDKEEIVFHCDIDAVSTFSVNVDRLLLNEDMAAQ